jgi:hypothetical protein
LHPNSKLIAIIASNANDPGLKQLCRLARPDRMTHPLSNMSLMLETEKSAELRAADFDLL